MVANKRIVKELRDLMRDNNLYGNQYSVELVDDSNEHLIGTILGAPDTPFQRGVFRIDITIPDRYPFAPPVCRFLTNIWHPNISSVTGAVCLDILKDQWAAAMTIEGVLKSLQSFLSTPEPTDPQDAVVANQYLTHRELYNRTASYWTYTYAMTADNQRNADRNEFKDFEELVAKFVAKTRVTSDRALTSLSCSHWDLTKAVRSYTNR